MLEEHSRLKRINLSKCTEVLACKILKKCLSDELIPSIFTSTFLVAGQTAKLAMQHILRTWWDIQGEDSISVGHLTLWIFGWLLLLTNTKWLFWYCLALTILFNNHWKPYEGICKHIWGGGGGNFFFLCFHWYFLQMTFYFFFTFSITLY